MEQPAQRQNERAILHEALRTFELLLVQWPDVLHSTMAALQQSIEACQRVTNSMLQLDQTLRIITDASSASLEEQPEATPLLTRAAAHPPQPSSSGRGTPSPGDAMP